MPLLLDPASWGLFPPWRALPFQYPCGSQGPEGGMWHHILLPLISVTLKLLQHPAASLSFHLPLKSLSKDGCRLQPFQQPAAGPSQAAFSLLLAYFLCQGVDGPEAPAPGWPMPELLPPTCAGHSCRSNLASLCVVHPGSVVTFPALEALS